MSKLFPHVALVAGALFFAAVSAQAGGTVCFEAESAKALTAPMRVVNVVKPPPEAKEPPVKGASGESYIEIPEGAGKPPEAGGTATYAFEISDPGTYYLWCRVWWADGCGNSVGMKIDSAPAFTFGQDATYKSWHWFRAPLKLQQLELTKGAHTLTVSNREDGVILDQILFVKERRYVPVDIEAITPAAGK